MVWPGDAGFEFLRARFAPAPEGSTFRFGVEPPFIAWGEYDRPEFVGAVNLQGGLD